MAVLPGPPVSGKMPWFHEKANPSRGGGANWPVNTSSGSLTAYKEMVADPYYQVRLAARPF